jgi:hypothetical protein
VLALVAVICVFRFVFIIIDLLTNLFGSLSVLSNAEIAEIGGPVSVESCNRDTIRGLDEPPWVPERIFYSITYPKSLGSR